MARYEESAPTEKHADTHCAIMALCLFVLGFVLVPTGDLKAQSLDVVPSDSSASTGDQNSSPAASPDDNSVASPLPLTFGERLSIYEHSFINPENLIGPALGAGIGQARNSPHEWGQGADAYGIRFASGFGRSVISRTIALGVATADGEDSRFFPSNETGIWRRTRHAIAATFVSRTANGGRMPAYSRFVGDYAAGFIANAWEPRSQNDAGHAMERGSTALASSVGWHVFEEFWPDIRGAFHRRH
jgi:hypothetical protein